MNLYLRLIYTIIRACFRPRVAFSDPISLSLRILPNDLDINNHLNNARYLSLLDLASIDLFLRSGIFRKMLQMRLKPMVGGAIVSYRKGLSLFERCTLTMQLDAWDDRWSYFRFAFKNAKGVLSATGYFKGALVSKKGFYPNQEFIKHIGYPEEKSELPMAVVHWMALEKAMVPDQAK